MDNVNGWTLKVAGWLASEAGDEFWARRAAEIEVEVATAPEELDDDGFPVFGGEIDVEWVAISRLADEMEQHIHRCFRVPYSRLRGVDFLAIAREYVREYA